jgi:alpha-methylacyl-CoA racemase
MDQSSWDTLRAGIAQILIQRPRDAWVATFDGTDACVAPVVSLGEAAQNDQLRARGTDVVGPSGSRAARPRAALSRTQGALSSAPSASGADTRTALTRWGLASSEIDEFLTAGVVVQA